MDVQRQLTDALGCGALHAPAPADAPVNHFRGVPLAERHTVFLENLDAVGDGVDRAAVLRQWAVALATPRWDGPPVWLHGDLHPANVLVHDGRVSAVIDFGDITSGDPAIDLAIAWMMLPTEHHGAFRDAYAAVNTWGISEHTWTRVRGWALVLLIVFLAHSADNPQLLLVGQRTMTALLR